MKRKGLVAWAIIIAVLIIDQVIKLHVKTTMTLGESIRITDWFYITFIENNGMAWGMTFVNKLFLSILRLAAVGAIGWFIRQEVKQKGRMIYVVFLSLVLAGAAGNIIDSLFYGLCFTASTPYAVSYSVPFGTGYAGFLMGKVVDMFYFPIIHTTWPTWMPLVGGENFTFFSPVFNFADASITTGVICLLLFWSKDLAVSGETINIARGKQKSDNDNTEEEKKKTEED